MTPLLTVPSNSPHKPGAASDSTQPPPGHTPSVPAFKDPPNRRKPTPPIHTSQATAENPIHALGSG